MDLSGKLGLIVGVANEHSIAFGCAAKLRGFGAEVAATVAEQGFMHLDAPVSRLTMPDIPSPHNPVPGHTPPAPQWKSRDYIRGILPKDDPHGG